MKKRYLLLAAVGTAAALTVACARKKPVVYANTKHPMYPDDAGPKGDAGVPGDGGEAPSDPNGSAAG